MARSITEIQNQIIAEKEARPELNRLSSASAVAVWRVWVYVTAVAIHFHERIFDLFRTEVETKIAARQAGTPDWYIQKVFDFQLGDQVQVVNGIATYAVVDPTKRIITRASFREVEGDAGLVLQIRVAKGEIGLEEPLTNEEVFQLKTYLERVKFAGINIQVISLNPDRMRLTAEIFFDGIYNPTTVATNVKNAIREYFKNLDFDGQVYINKIIDVVQQVEGVIDIDVNAASAMVGATENVIDRVYLTAAGYIVEDDTADYTFDDLLTFTAQNV